jgi:hypothetical protein
MVIFAPDRKTCNRVAIKMRLFVAAGFNLRLLRRDAWATCLTATWYEPPEHP